MQRTLAVLVGTLLIVGASACTDADGSDSPAGGTGTVRVFAAASLTDAFGEAAAAFEDDEPGTSIELNLAGSASLREQILAGAPADVFAPADGSHMDAVVAEGLAHDPELFATNALEIAVPAGNPAGVDGLEDLARRDLLIGLCAVEVPCGALGRQVLDDVGVIAAPDTDEPDVRALLTKIAVGELDAGIVYRTDVRAAGDDVEGIEIRDEVNVVAEYPIAVLDDASDPAAAASFVDFVLSPRGQAILADHGFGPP